MADHREELQTLDQEPSNPRQPPKRKPDLDSVDEGEEDWRKKTKPQPEIPSSCPKEPPDDVKAEEDVDGGEEDGEEAGVDPNGNAAVFKGKGVAAAVDKGKGKMVVDEDEDEDEDDSSDDDDSGDVIGGEDDESDFSDDPLAEVDLSNILPSRTRQRSPPPQGAYLLSDKEDDDDDDEVDDDVNDSE
ncbi:histone H2A.Z-specific chaperone CHZ1-like [Phoenix dactylifera]|uniref:Histone H2A.Z-specific chaperone CHZ1-like n=1 Tax=Phoenix dactylifera TaxID=42345 RepID=A0A8B7CPD0_PHODC|nr:histone H2A.Z-specific chaperone CHZ1-like [Phoenix dactylifera]